MCWQDGLFRCNSQRTDSCRNQERLGAHQPKRLAAIRAPSRWRANMSSCQCYRFSGRFSLSLLYFFYLFFFLEGMQNSCESNAGQENVKDAVAREGRLWNDLGIVIKYDCHDRPNADMGKEGSACNQYALDHIAMHLYICVCVVVSPRRES